MLYTMARERESYVKVSVKPQDIFRAIQWGNNSLGPWVSYFKIALERVLKTNSQESLANRQ